MAPKAKKTPKQLQTLATLTALQATYKAASRKHGVPVIKSVADAIEAKVELGKSVDKIVLSGPTVTSGVMRAVVECLASYSLVKNLSCFGGTVADEGLLAVAQLLRASVDKWYKGSKLRLLEVVNDGVGLAGDRWAERFTAHMQSDGTTIATRGAGFEMPSLLMGVAEPVTRVTMERMAPPAPVLNSDDIERRFTSLYGSLAHHTSVYNQVLRDQAEAVPPTPPYTFSLLVLKELSLSLGAQPSSLQVLNLDHNVLGDEGTRILAMGLRRCGKLKQLSLAHCGIGPAGVAALCTTLEPDPLPDVAALQPKYQMLNLSRNPLGGAGLVALCPGLARCVTLKSVSLSAVGLTEEDLGPLQALSDACGANPVIEQVDLDANHIGDRGVEIFLPMLSASPQMRRFRVTDRVSRAVGERLGAILKANFPLKKKKKAAPKATK